ncbi:hypothetical protein PYW08_014380 [Mythimna loreyi]|uniref:Uncharacterized protein n=1 Tax=Mythimna loreyi TaxID=667449 RepID=A0ACC2R7X7_9NEOP|nr:hypothetical protein PYW08_014380 [Mythimna loreyi]
MIPLAPTPIYPADVATSIYDLNTASLQSLVTGVKYEDPRFQLNLVQKKELSSERPVIPSTKCERLAYYRAFTSSQSKTEIVVPKSQNINSFLWFYACNMLFKSWPHGFVHYFYAAYAPEEHMYVSKMVPIAEGIKYLFVMVGFLEMVSCVDLMVVMFNYTLFGIIATNPWNRCEDKRYFDEKYNVTVVCYEIKEFARMFRNDSHSIDGPFYVHSDTGEYFQVAQVAYYREIIDRIANSWDISIFLVVWVFVQILQVHAWKRYFWKALHYSHWGINFVDFCALGYLTVAHYTNMDPAPPAQKKFELKQKRDTVSEFWVSDLAMLAESITAPPIVHVLASRSTQEIDPTADSATMIISNALLHVFRGLLTIRVKIYCEGLLHTEMPDPQFNEKTWFYLWPIFWQQFYLGDIYSVLYTVFSMLSESLILMVTNLCITETVVYEWPKIKRWQVTLVSTLIGIVIHYYTTIDTRAILWIYGKGIATLAEVVFLYFLYPLGRLVDDYTFHYGVRPTKLKILSLRFVPVYYMFKIYVMYYSFCNEMSAEPVNEEHSHYVWSWSLIAVPIVVGLSITIFKQVFINKTPWSHLIRPVPKWGPRDFSVRQLRKQFDSRFYIDFKVPRILSRYLLSKKEPKMYKVDVRYDYQKRSHISKAVGFGEINDEKKEKTS